MTLRSIDPASGELFHAYEELDAAEVSAAVAGAEETFQDWRRSSWRERREALGEMAAELRRRQEELARLAAREMGKPLKEGRAEVEKCARTCDHYAEHAEAYLASQAVPTEARRSYVAFEPLGVVLAVMPWNFPFWQVFRFAAPTLAAGNTALLKHAGNVTGCALAIEEIVTAGAGRPLLRALRLSSPRVADVIADPRVRAVTLTGSTPAGRAVAARAGEHLKKTVLELGGSDPYVVLEDADLAAAAKVCVASRLLNSGQSCIAAKRFVAVEAVAVEFERRFVAEMRVRRMGSPFDEASDIGPLARRDLRDDLHRQVEESVARGARRELGGEVPPGPGAFYPPSVLTGVQPGMPAFDEELFGPVAALIRARDEEEALRLANDSPYGLGAAVFTRDDRRGEEVARNRLEAGSCFVNDFVRSDPRLPFGGVKASGYGRELGSFGIREFVNVKTVWVA